MCPDLEYEKLSSRTLHDLAVRRARCHRDIGFFWRLMEAMPVSTSLNDITDAGRGEVAEVLRPFYIEYLTRLGGN